MSFAKRLCTVLLLVSLATGLSSARTAYATADPPPANAPASTPLSPAEEKARKDAREREDWLRHARDSEVGKASWYGGKFHNRKTASGLLYDMHTFTAAHKTLPLGTVVRVTDQTNGKSVMVCVTDRGPYVRGRIIDLSWAAAQKLDLASRGVCKVELEVVSDETGKPLQEGSAYYVRFQSGRDVEEVGPFYAFADAAAMHEALLQAHPDAELILGEVLE